MTIKPIPDGYHSVTPYLIIDGAANALEYYKAAFHAVEEMRIPGPNGKVMHAEITIGDSKIMLSDEFPELGARGPKTIGGSPVGIALYVPDVDSVFKRAIEAGGTEERPLQDQFYGDRSGTLRDPFGHQWTVATHIEDLTPEEIGKRHEEFVAQQGGG